ncbi:MAG: PAS domain S-box protein [Nitrospirae bacterium]|nr:PAS domain S-box protein [Nitrospirota bacterium]
MRRQTKAFFSALSEELTVPKAVSFFFMVLLVANLSALVDTVLHPDIPYFDEEHLIIGGAYALFLSVMFLVLVVYVTKLKMAAKTLRESEEKFKVLAEKSPNMIFINKRGQVVYTNEKCSELMGYTKDEFLSPGFDFLTLIAPESLELIKNAFSQQMKGEDVQPFEYGLLTREGKRINAIVTSKVFEYEGETSVIGIVTDITERIKFENALKESEEKFRNIFDQARDIIFTVGQDTLYTSLNAAFEKITGWSRDEWLGKSFAPILHPEDLSKAVSIMQRLLQGETVEMFELRVRKKSGDFFIGEFTVAPVKQGETVIALGHVRDISERKLDEEKIRILTGNLELKVQERTRQLIEAQDELVRREKLAILGQLSGSVGHELRNPLGVISNAVYFLQTVMPDAEERVKEYLGIIKSEVSAAERIITDLLDFTRTKTPQFESVQVSELINRGLAKCIFPENIALQLDLSETLPMVKVDPLHMEQIMQNLVTNAIQAMSDGGELRISAKKWIGGLGSGVREKEPIPSPQSSLPDGNFIEISVADTGGGIAPEIMSRLFQPLFSTKARGIGLGLIVSKNLAEANGGRIEVESRLGKGTTFTLILPAAGNRQ